MVGREREWATSGVLLFAEGAACRQGCLPITGQPRRVFRDAPAAGGGPARPCCTSRLVWRSHVRRLSCLPPATPPDVSARRQLLGLPRTRESRAADVMARRRSGQHMSGQPDDYAMQCAIVSVAGASDPAARHPQPAKHHRRCSGAKREMHFAPGKSQSHAAENPARVANVMPPRSTRCLCCGRLGELPEIATPRPCAPKLLLPWTGHGEPQQQTAVCAHTCKDSKQSCPSVLSVLLGSGSCAWVTVAPNTCLHLTTSKAGLTPSHPPKPPSMPEYCPAALP